MQRKLRIKYYVEPDPDALWPAVRRSTFVEMASEAVRRQRPRPHRHQRRLTPKATFQLAGRSQRALALRMPWADLDLFWVDERCVPPDDADSNYRMTREAMLDHVPLQPAADSPH